MLLSQLGGRLLRGQTVFVVVFLYSWLFQREVHVGVKNVFLILYGVVFFNLRLRSRTESMPSSRIQVRNGIFLPDSCAIYLPGATSILSKVTAQDPVLLHTTLLIFNHLFD